MPISPSDRSQCCIPRHLGRAGSALLLCLVLGLTLASWGAAESTKGGTIVWAVHEGMPHFDIHADGTYTLHSLLGRSITAF